MQKTSLIRALLRGSLFSILSNIAFFVFFSVTFIKQCNGGGPGAAFGYGFTALLLGFYGLLILSIAIAVPIVLGYTGHKRPAVIATVIASIFLVAFYIFYFQVMNDAISVCR